MKIRLFTSLFSAKKGSLSSRRLSALVPIIFAAATLNVAPAYGRETAKPVNPDVSLSNLPCYALRTGYRTNVSLRKFVSAVTPGTECACELMATDTVDIHFRPVSFKYDRGEGSAFPESVRKLFLELHDVSDGGDKLLAELPFVVDGSTMQIGISSLHERQDSVLMSLPPGVYRIEYKGFQSGLSAEPSLPKRDSTIAGGIGKIDTTLVFSRTASAAAPLNSEALLCGSSVSLSLECLPLLPDYPPVTSWNSISLSKSRDGSDKSLVTTTVWLDDFGREESVHLLDASPRGMALASLTEYDPYGLVTRRWLPAVVSRKKIASSGGVTVIGYTHSTPEELKKSSTANNGEDKFPFYETVREDSPLARSLEAHGPGEAWRAAGRHVSTSYLSDTGAEPRLACLRPFVIGAADDTTLVIRGDGLRADGSLKVVSVTDEDGWETLTFTDALGRNVLTRRVVTGENGVTSFIDTHSIYDGMGNLIAVLPPALSERLSSGQPLGTAEVRQYAFLYRYDAHDRLCAVKEPGKDWVLTVYDDADRPVFIQDGVQRQRGESTFILHDIHGRECVTGVCRRNVALGEELRGVIVAQYAGKDGPLDGYSCGSVDGLSPRVMTASYYDGYEFVDDLPTGLPDSSALYGVRLPSLTGRKVGTCRHVLAENVGTARVWALSRYDSRGRVSHTETAYPDGCGCIEDVERDFLGRPTRVLRLHRKDTVTMKEEVVHTYDKFGRLISSTHSLDGSEPTLVERNSYDALGRLVTKERGMSEDLTTTYGYNVRSWLTSVDGKLFQERLHYEDLRSGSLPDDRRRYGGGLSSIEWLAGSDSGMRSYDFDYDGLGRLLSAGYGEKGKALTGYGTKYTYDISGNLLTLLREGDVTPTAKGIVDNLTLTYDGCRLVSVSDAAKVPTVQGSADFRDGASLPVEYTYDRNGNVTSDLNRGVVSATYSPAGQPAVTISADVRETLASLPDGTRLSREVRKADGTVKLTEYRDNLVYEDGKLKYVLFEGGIVSIYGKWREYAFFMKDHLGSVRVVADRNGKALQVSHYYPYGLEFATTRMASVRDFKPGGAVIGNLSAGSDVVSGEGSASGGGSAVNGGIGIGGGTTIGVIDLPAVAALKTQPYRFLGNELQPDIIPGLHDFHARRYDPALGRFLSADPLAANSPGFTPYGYCLGDPEALVDPDGLETHVAMMDDGKYMIIGGVLNKDRNIYMYRKDSDGKYTIRGRSIGITTSTTSFYNADKGGWAIGELIDPMDDSGQNFLDNMFKNTPAMFDDYMVNAVNGGKYDFKVTNGEEKNYENDKFYRGMPIGMTADGKQIYSSARDIGNIAAGFVAGANGMSWTASRVAFDAYQSKTDRTFSVESASTRNAEYYGWRIGSNLLPSDKSNNLFKSLWNLLTK